VAAVIQLLRRKQITSCFIDLGHPDKEKGVADVFDTLIFTSHSARNDPEKVRIQVAHSGPCNADRAPKDLERVPDGGRGRLILHRGTAGADKPAREHTRNRSD
jgi:hypothetical protein